MAVAAVNLYVARGHESPSAREEQPLLITGPVRSRLRISTRGPAAERGITAVEYALMAAVLVVLLVGGTYYLFQSVENRFDRNQSCASVAYRGGGC